ncbi:phosphatidate cytidylyltransferase [bacterium]|nr:phosphatidate cytidylyltransferase [bacterium]
MNFLLRSLVALVGVPLVYFLTRFGSWPLALFLSLCSWLGASEFYFMARSKQLDALDRAGVLLAAALPLALWLLLSGPLPAAGTVVLAAPCVLLLLAGLALRLGVEGSLVRVSLSVFGALYTGGLFSLQLLLRHTSDAADGLGFRWLFLAYLLTWSVDVGSYLAGRAFGRHKLAPAISPGKTVEGAVGGIIASAGMALGAGAHVMGLFGAGHALALGLLFAVVAPLGDLVESAFKRDCGVKDSSNLIPGHGGVLDRFDSLLFTVPLALVYRALFF